MHMIDLGTLVRADERSFVWRCTGSWLEVVGETAKHVGQAVHAEMGKGAEAPNAVLILAPEVAYVASDGSKYAVDNEVVRDPKRSEMKRRGAVLFRLDGDATTRNVKIEQQLREVTERLLRTPPPTQPGPMV